jgi:hypothetical protein
VQLVSVKTVEGWYYDLWYPSYSWADTPNSWQAPGLKFSGESNEHTLSYPPLEEAARAFQGRDGSGVQWNIERDFSLFSTLGRGYPVVLSAMNGRHAGRSSLDPDFVARRLAAAFSESIAL